MFCLGNGDDSIFILNTFCWRDEISFNCFVPGRSDNNSKLVYSQSEEYFISIVLYLLRVTAMVD